MNETMVYDLVNNNMTWTVKFVAYLHDMFKFSEEVLDEHGKLAAYYFKNDICDKVGLDLSYPIISFMFEAIITHSNKSLSLNNAIQRILVDADILSKFNMDTMKERKEIKYPDKSLREIFDILNTACKEYVGKTPGFKNRLNYSHNTLRADIRIEEIHNGRR